MAEKVSKKERKERKEKKEKQSKGKETEETPKPAQEKDAVKEVRVAATETVSAVTKNPTDTEAAKSSDDAAVTKKTEKEGASSGRSRTTLFVSTIPYHATSEQLQEFFSEIGPVRSCFVVADSKAEPGKPRNRGYGYVSYALPEDADRALKDLKKTKFLDMRVLKIDFAMTKKVIEDRKANGLPLNDDAERQKARKEKMQKQKPVVEPAADGDAAPVAFNAPRTPKIHQRISKNIIVEITGLPADITQKHVYKKARKFGDVSQVIYPVSKRGEILAGTAHAVYSTPAEADNAVKHLDGHQFKGAEIRAKTVVDESKIAKQARLIVRNLPWQCNEQHLRKLFGKHGTIVDILIPPAVNGKARGFGFVQFETQEEAAQAIEQVNGVELMKRLVAVDWALSKAQFEKAVQEEQQEEGGDAATPAATVQSASADADGDDDNDDEEEDEKQFYLDTIGSDAENSADDAEEGDSNEADSDEESDAGDDVEVTFDDEKKKDATPKPSKLAANVQDNCTLFIRNLNFDTTEEELSEALSHFGELRYSRITMDRATGRSRGTGFVCYKRKEDAETCLAEHEIARRASEALHGINAAPVDTKAQKHKKNLAPTKSILTPEPSLTAKASPFLVGGRFLNVTLAVNRSEANQLAEDGKLRRRADDSRNMYLMREGVIFPDTEAAKTLTPSELSKRQTSFAERKRILTTNPNLFISRTRLSVRNLGLKIDDKELKRVAGIAVRKFWDDVKKGLREGLEPEVIKEEENEGRPAPSGSRRAVVTQAKILRSKDRIDAATKQPRSKGYGFIEFDSHADALACLRWMNNNPRAFNPAPAKAGAADATPAAAVDDEEATSVANSSGKRPIVEFAIENRQVIKRREERQAQFGRKDDGKKRGREDGEDGGADGGPLKKKRFGEIWRDRRIAAKEKGKPLGKKTDGARPAQKWVKPDGAQQKWSKPDGSKPAPGGWKDNNKSANGKRKWGSDGGDKVTAVGQNKRGKFDKSLDAKQPRPSPAAAPAPARPSAADDQAKKSKKAAKAEAKLSKDQRDDKNFDNLVQKYKKNLFGAGAGTNASEKKQAATTADDKSIKRWFS